MKNATAANSQALARTYSQSETDRLVATAEDFQKYANDLRNGLTPSLGSLPESFSQEDALEVLEMTTNYFYGRPNEH